jgi:hypothetical protein
MGLVELEGIDPLSLQGLVQVQPPTTGFESGFTFLVDGAF